MKKDKKGDRSAEGKINQSPQLSDEERDRQQQQLREESTPAAGEGTPVYLYGDSTLQTPEEHEHDRRVDPRKDDSIDVSDSDLDPIKAGRLTGRENAPGRDEEA
jgi:hypothetical protein